MSGHYLRSQGWIVTDSGADGGRWFAEIFKKSQTKRGMSFGNLNKRKQNKRKITTILQYNDVRFIFIFNYKWNNTTLKLKSSKVTEVNWNFNHKILEIPFK